MRRKMKRTKREETARKNHETAATVAAESVPWTRVAPWRWIDGVAAAARRRNVGAAARRSSPGKQWRKSAGATKSSSEEK
jgi:hypothetical protein